MCVTVSVEMIPHTWVVIKHLELGRTFHRITHAAFIPKRLAVTSEMLINTNIAHILICPTILVSLARYVTLNQECTSNKQNSQLPDYRMHVS